MTVNSLEKYLNFLVISVALCTLQDLTVEIQPLG